MRMVLILSAILAAGMPLANAATNYYKWTDEKGVTHYSARKPHDREAEVIRVSSGQTVPAAAESKSQSAAKTVQAPRGGSTGPADNLKDPERCETARNNLETLRANARVRMKGEDGEIRYLSEEEKAEKTQEFEQAVAESC
ncbi:DUF4124 domain-containing protein [Proteobacteria bacterium 005FR1]|nr:DUF4124 domain-containing protein [Proteobacteria bacterium 005FR1]